MKTVLQVVNRAYSKIQVKQPNISLTDQEVDDAISELNAMMWEHDADGLHVGWADISSSSDQVGPDWMTTLLENGLAVRMAPEFGVQINPTVIAMYESALRVAEKVLVDVANIPFPNILPTGQGEGTYRLRYNYFTDFTEGALYDETGGYITDEEGAKINTEIDFSNSGDTNQ